MHFNKATAHPLKRHTMNYNASEKERSHIFLPFDCKFICEIVISFRKIANEISQNGMKMMFEMFVRFQAVGFVLLRISDAKSK